MTVVITKLMEDNVYLNIAEFETAPVETKGWEAHRKFLDIHLILRGTEQIDVNFTPNMKPLDYLEANDFADIFRNLNGISDFKRK